MNEFKDDKVVAFAGHRYEWHCIGVENRLPEVLEDLINKGYTIFYDGHYGAFDEKCAHAVLQLKHKYPHIKLIRILTYYNLWILLCLLHSQINLHCKTHDKIVAT